MAAYGQRVDGGRVRLIDADGFRLHKTLVAVDLGTFTYGDRDVHRGTVCAVWFASRRGVLRACIGHISDLQPAACGGRAPGSAEEFLAAYTTNHGADCHARWDGETYWGAPEWGAMEPAAIVRHMPFLQGMLDGYPAIPAGYNGWWGF
jgi:hypothetical protein